MANVTTLKKGGTGVFAAHKPEIVKVELDIAEAVALGLATTNLVSLLSVPAETLVRVLSVENVTAVSGTTIDLELGDTGDDDRFVASQTSGTAGANHTITASGAGYLYTAADTISAKITSDALATGIIRYVFEVTNTGRNANAVAPSL